MLKDFAFSPLSYFLILVLIPGVVQTAKKWEWFAVGNRPLALGMGLAFFFVGFAEAIEAGLVPEVVLPWVRVVVLGLAGSLSVGGYWDMVKKFTGNGGS